MATFAVGLQAGITGGDARRHGWYHPTWLVRSALSVCLVCRAADLRCRVIAPRLTTVSQHHHSRRGRLCFPVSANFTPTQSQDCRPVLQFLRKLILQLFVCAVGGEAFRGEGGEDV